jgi:2-hydroxychromene-2-carboxylate isomerase
MAANIEVYYDFRSPYAYFASHRIRRAEIVRRGHQWRWRPVSVDALLNLQADREPWAPYVDPLSQPKRAHLIADVRRLATYYGLSLRAPRPSRPNSIPALCLALLLDEHERPMFGNVVFDVLWQEQRDISDLGVLANCLERTGVRAEALGQALEGSTRTNLERETREAYARGIFGVPTFVFENEVFFGNDRIDLLLWTIERRTKDVS